MTTDEVVTLQVQLHDTDPSGNSDYGTIDGREMVRAFLPEFYDEDCTSTAGNEGVVLFREFHELDVHKCEATRKALEELTGALSGLSDSAIVRRAQAVVEAWKWSHDGPAEFDRFVDRMIETGEPPK